MASAPGHRLGQIVGDALELSVEPILRRFANAHGLYLDQKGPRATRPGQMKCRWIDGLGNSHDLDFVLERGGTEDRIGNPAAFIEIAWRRYTKHSRAKAQEIQGAVLPLLAKWAQVKPLGAAVVAGRWTTGALNQLRSNGFSVLHLPYDDIVSVFSSYGIDLDLNEDTADEYSQLQIARWTTLTPGQKEDLGGALRDCAPDAYAAFGRDLRYAITRAVERVSILPLHGTGLEFSSIDRAIENLLSYVPPEVCGPINRFELRIVYSNGDKVEAQFANNVDAIDFLGTFAASS